MILEHCNYLHLNVYLGLFNSEHAQCYVFVLLTLFPISADAHSYVLLSPLHFSISSLLVSGIEQDTVATRIAHKFKTKVCLIWEAIVGTSKACELGRAEVGGVTSHIPTFAEIWSSYIALR